MAWIELHQAVWTHRKTFELAARLDLDETYAAAHVIRLWTWALDNSPEGDLSALSDRAVAFGAGWRGDACAFVSALVEVGWLDANRRIHDWEEYAGRLAERRRANAERMRASRAGNVRSTERERVGLPDLTGPDLTGPDLTPTPQPPPASGKGNAADAAGKKRRGGWRNGVVEHDETASPPSEPLAPATTPDREVWDRARADLQSRFARGNAEALGLLETIGRAPDGGLHLRAPPGMWNPERFRGQVVMALLDAGDEHAAKVAIVEGRPGEGEHASERNGAANDG